MGSNGSGLLSRAAILDVQDVESEEVEVPEWGGKICVRALTRAEQTAWAARIFGEDADLKSLEAGEAKFDLSVAGKAQAMAVYFAAIDSDGARLFTDESDIEVLARKSDEALDRVFEVIQRLSKLKVTVEEEAGKSEAAPTVS